MSDQKEQIKINTAPIPLSPVKSSQIAEIGHDAATSTLAIRFKGRNEDDPGSIYHYANFGADQFKRFQEAESIGTFFGANIKNAPHRHPYARVIEKKD